MGEKIIMRRYIMIFQLVVFLSLISPAKGSDDSADILKGIQEKYQALPGLTMTYTREVITRSMSMLGNKVKGDTATGRIFFAPPCRLRLEQESPRPETLITNGETIWWLIPDKKRAHCYPAQKFGKELSLLSDIFRGLTSVENGFKIAAIPHKVKNEFQIELRPDPPWQEISRIVLTVGNGYEIQVIEIHNQLGGITRFKIENPAVTETFKDNFFLFMLPDGVQLVKEEN